MSKRWSKCLYVMRDMEGRLVVNEELYDGLWSGPVAIYELREVGEIAVQRSYRRKDPDQP